MTTSELNLTANYSKVASSGSWTAIQNTSNCDIDLIISSAAPVATDWGFRFKPLDTILPTTYGDDDVYVRVVSGQTEGKVAISA